MEHDRFILHFLILLLINYSTIRRSTNSELLTGSLDRPQSNEILMSDEIWYYHFEL